MGQDKKLHGLLGKCVHKSSGMKLTGRFVNIDICKKCEQKFYRHAVKAPDYTRWEHAGPLLEKLGMYLMPHNFTDGLKFGAGVITTMTDELGSTEKMFTDLARHENPCVAIRDAAIKILEAEDETN